MLSSIKVWLLEKSNYIIRARFRLWNLGVIDPLTPIFFGVKPNFLRVKSISAGGQSYVSHEPEYNSFVKTSKTVKTDWGVMKGKDL